MPGRYAEDVLRSSLVQRVFSGRLVENRWRGELVEQLVAAGLCEDRWTLCSGDWAAWDFQHPELDLRIQVKQTARRQTWGMSPPTNRYLIKPAKGFYKGATWSKLSVPCRLAEIYIFAHHPDESANANHWDANAWQFHVVPETSLPQSSQSISVRDVAALRSAVGICDLAASVRDVATLAVPNALVARASDLPAELGDPEEAPGGSL